MFAFFGITIVGGSRFILRKLFLGRANWGEQHHEVVDAVFEVVFSNFWFFSRQLPAFLTLEIAENDWVLSISLHESSHMLNGKIFLIQVGFFILLIVWSNVVSCDFDTLIAKVIPFPVSQLTSLAFFHQVGCHSQQKVPNCRVCLGIGLEALPDALSAEIEHILFFQ